MEVLFLAQSKPLKPAGHEHTKPNPVLVGVQVPPLRHEHLLMTAAKWWWAEEETEADGMSSDPENNIHLKEDTLSHRKRLLVDFTSNLYHHVSIYANMKTIGHKLSVNS